MDQSHVTQRQQSKKRGKEEESAAGQHTKTESGSSSGDVPTAETTYLPGFSAEQTQSLKDALDNAIRPFQDHLTKILANRNEELAKFSARMDQMQALLEKAFPFGEISAKQANSLPTFSTPQLEHPQQATPSKFKSAKQPGPDPQPTPQETSSNLTPNSEEPAKQADSIHEFSVPPAPQRQCSDESYSRKPDQAQKPNFGDVPTHFGFPARNQMGGQIIQMHASNQARHN